MVTRSLNQPFRFLTLLIMLTISVGCSRALDLTNAPSEKNSNHYELFLNMNAPSHDAFIALQRLTEPLLLQRRWSDAAAFYRKYTYLFPSQEMQKRISKAIEILENGEEGLIITNLSFAINTTANEYAPVLSADESRLYFTGRDRVGNIGGEDIFYADFVAEQWMTAQGIGRTINTKKRNESLDGVSSDGNTLLLMGNYGTSFGSGDLYFVEKTVDGWDEIKHFPRPINTEYFEGNAFLSADGKALIFTSDRPDGIGQYNPKGQLFNGAYVGNTDIYVSMKTDEGWGEPINIGATINTSFAEYSPFLHPDGKTLYFSSDGHPGLGRLDVFKSERLNENSWTLWSEPVNLGKEINTAGHDWGYKISTSGKLAYFSANGKDDSRGKDDIYTITVPEKVRPNPVAIIKGIVTDENNLPLNADIFWEDLTTRQSVGKLKSNPSDGNYIIMLPLDKNYGYYASKDGFYPSSNSINLIGINDPITVEENIILTSIQIMIIEEVPIVLNNIFFEFDKYDLLPESFPELDRLVVILKNTKDKKVQILGHTDNVGTEAYNLNLSQQRAESVMKYLIQNGCNALSISAKGYGYSLPIDTNETDEGRAANRRVEFKFLK